jgi:protease I
VPKFFIIILVLIIIGFGIWFWQSQKTSMEQVATKEEIKIETPREKAKKAVMIIAFEDFRDQEYFLPKEILEKGGAVVKTASTKKGIAVGADGGEIEIDLLVNEINPEDFDAIIFIGGPGCLKYLDNENSYNLTRETIKKGKILASICISPVILAKAGVLDGKKATVWTSALDREPVKILEENGAEFVDEKVVQDGNIITANGPIAAEEFGEKILENLR